MNELNRMYAGWIYIPNRKQNKQRKSFSEKKIVATQSFILQLFVLFTEDKQKYIVNIGTHDESYGTKTIEYGR